MLLNKSKNFFGIMFIYLVLISYTVGIGIFDNVDYLRKIEMTNEMYGDYNYNLKYLDDVDVEELKAQDFVDKAGLSKYIYSADRYKFYLNVMNYDEDYISMTNSKITQGRASKNSNEVVFERGVTSAIGGNLLGNTLMLITSIITDRKYGGKSAIKIMNGIDDLSDNRT